MIPIIIVDYSAIERTQQYIKDCSRKIISKQKLLYIIVETGQEDKWISAGSWEVLSKKDKLSETDDRILYLNIYQMNQEQILFVQLKENYGFAVANNIGTKVAVAYLGNDTSNNLIIFSNNDIQFPNQIDLHVYDKIFDRDRTIAVIGPKIVGIDGKDQSPHKYISLYDRWMHHFITWLIDSIVNIFNSNSLLWWCLVDSLYDVRFDNSCLFKSFMEYKITEVIASLYAQNAYLLEGNLLNENEKEYYKSIKAGIGDEMAANAIRAMAGFMKRYYGKDVIILLDEYDTPMQEAWISGYWDEAVEFFRGFFNNTFKTNPYLCRGLITGITRISKESIFSDLNNLKVITTTSNQYATAFGFTEEEVFKALDDIGLNKEKQGVKAWYDGFTFGSYSDIYNPWSIAFFMDNCGEYDTYWASTNGNGLVNSLIRQGSVIVKSALVLSGVCSLHPDI